MVICLVLREIEKCTLEIFIICQLTMVMESYTPGPRLMLITWCEIQLVRILEKKIFSFY